MNQSNSSLGQSLREWRRVRQLSQMELSLLANVSARHISFIETGKSHPTREMLLTLAEAMELELDQCNSLLIAAGYSIEKPEESIEKDSDPSLQDLIRRLIRNFEPYPALIINAEFDILAINKGVHLLDAFIPGALTRYSNLLELMMAEDGLRPLIANWEEVQLFVIDRLREFAFSAGNLRLQTLLTHVIAQQLTPVAESEELPQQSTLYVSIQFKFGNEEAHFSSLILIPGTHINIVPQDLRIVILIPTNDKTETLLQMLVASL